MHQQVRSRVKVHGAASQLGGLVDEMLAYYIDWRRDAKAVEEAYRNWSNAPAREGASRFPAYAAALDQEEASATAYALMVTEVERALQHA